MRDPRVLYTSSPDRGLDLVLELWPEVRYQVPEATLGYCYPGYFEHAARTIPALAEFAERIRALSRHDSVTPLGPLSQPQLAQLMLSSRVWVHPSWCTPVGDRFYETSCIGAMEAQAAGLHIVASNWGALHETVRVGRLVGAEPLSDRWRAEFVRGIVEGLTDPQVQARAARKGPQAAADFGWAPVADRVAALVEG